MTALIIVFAVFTLMAFAEIFEDIKEKISQRQAKKELLKNPSYYTYDEEEIY